MTLLEKNSNVNRIFENKFMSNHHQYHHPNNLTINLDTQVTGMNKKSQNNSSINSDVESRRSSGNSVTIKITNDNNVTLDDESLENILNENYMILNEAERDRVDDFEVEDTTSNSIEELNKSKKKLKERKKLVRSTAQQKHHLVPQESEDQPEPPQDKNVYKSQNTAFDELFAAANTGNFVQSAHVEAKMAIAASKNGLNEDDCDNGLQVPFRKDFNNGKNRSQSFRSRTSFKKISPSDVNEKVTKPAVASLKINDSNPLTRSQSCKRPASFKRMTVRNLEVSNSKKSPNASPATTPVAPANILARRATQCSAHLTEDIGKLQIDNDIDDSEVCRVRQFKITNKGIVNRGDSFKRSFKRSNNSLSSKKDASPCVPHDSNTLNLPDPYDGFNVNKSSSNSSNNGLNEPSLNGETASKSGLSVNYIGVNDNAISLSNLDEKNKVVAEPIKTYLVYMIGASTVGKNALIKQFKTSEYCGTYNVDSPGIEIEDEQNNGITIALDNIESVLQFVSMDIDMLKLSTLSLFEITRNNDAFIVAYSISDKASFSIAIDLLKSIRLSEYKKQPVILVGNKSDLVRKRSISREDAKLVAMKFGCKFVETSVAINDRVDDLLAGILKQIRLSESRKQQEPAHEQDETITTSFMELKKMNGLRFRDLSEPGKNHNRTFSDAHADDLKERPFNNRNNANFMSLKSNNLTRRLFRSKNKDSEVLSKEKETKFSKITFSDQQSFFHKVINNIFKKRADISQLGSVEDLFTESKANF